MKNLDMKLNGNITTISLNIGNEFGMFSSGKSLIIASAVSNVSIPEMDEIKIGLNTYRRP